MQREETSDGQTGATYDPERDGALLTPAQLEVLVRRLRAAWDEEARPVTQVHCGGQT